jgi:hypothetical protein
MGIRVTDEFVKKIAQNIAQPIFVKHINNFHTWKKVAQIVVLLL